MTTDLERRALALFAANTIDYADPLILARMWDADTELRDNRTSPQGALTPAGSDHPSLPSNERG